MTPLEQLLSAVGAEADPNSHGRQSFSLGTQGLNIVFAVSPTGTQFLQAVGCRRSERYRAALLDESGSGGGLSKGDELFTSRGDGTTSGRVLGSADTAALEAAVLFLIEDNGYAISVPVEVQTAGGDVSKLVEGFPNLYIQKCDGTDPVESLETRRRAVQHCRERKGAAMVHAKVIRPYSHSLSDDEKLYRPDEERTSDAERDPINDSARCPSKGLRHAGRSAGDQRRCRPRGERGDRPGAREPAARA